MTGKQSAILEDLINDIRHDGSTDSVHIHEYVECILNEKKFLIWSNEHQGWWVAGRSGYTQELRMAGEYSFDEACEICHDANQHLNVNDVPNEAMIPVGCMAKYKI